MCMEDIRIGRESGSADTTTDVPNASTQIASGNPFRTAITISSPAAGRLSVSFGTTAVDGRGIVIPANTGPQTLRIFDIGSMITQPVFAILSVAGPEAIGVHETTLVKQ